MNMLTNCVCMDNTYAILSKRYAHAAEHARVGSPLDNRRRSPTMCVFGQIVDLDCPFFTQIVNDSQRRSEASLPIVDCNDRRQCALEWSIAHTSRRFKSIYSLDWIIKGRFWNTFVILVYKNLQHNSSSCCRSF